MNTIQETLQKILKSIKPDPNKHIFTHLCKVFDKVGVMDVTYDPASDAYDISYEDGRHEIRSIFLTRKDIQDANL